MIIEPYCAWLYTIFTPKICFPVFRYFIPSRNQVMGERLGLGAESANHHAFPPTLINGRAPSHLRTEYM